MVSGFISRLVILIFGTLYPAYASYKAVRTKNVKEYVKWMMYWIVFALFTCAETFTDLFLSFWFPFYYEIKIITVIYLLSPATKGSSILYRKFVHPVLAKREQEIDEYIAKAKEQGYHTMLNLGSKGVNYATSLIMQTAIKGLPNLPLTPSSDFLPAKNYDAVDPFDLEDDCCNLKDLTDNSMEQDTCREREDLKDGHVRTRRRRSKSRKGGGGLVNHLRKSYSLSDLREEEDVSVSDGGGSRPIRRNQAQNSGQILPENHSGFYSPVIDFYERPVESDRTMFFPDDMSSGYSSGDNLYLNKCPTKEEVLVRTASLGPSSRIRTRAVTKSGLPKRASLSEGGSTRSPLELLESQNETDNFSSPFSHSTSYPLLASFPINYVSDYQEMYNKVILNQMFACINHHQSHSQVLDNKTSALENGFQKFGAPENRSVYITEENSVNSSEMNSKDHISDVTCEVFSDSNDNVIESSALGKNKETQEKFAETKTLGEVETIMDSDSLDGQEKQFQKRCGKYKKKLAPTPPTELPFSKPTEEDEESEFFTPNASPKASRQATSGFEPFPSKDNTDSEDKSKIPAVTTGEVRKKSKIKKGGNSISKKLNKMSFSFWHHKTGKNNTNSDSCSVASVESSSTRSETPQSVTEFFIPLKDKDDNDDKESIRKTFRI